MLSRYVAPVVLSAIGRVTVPAAASLGNLPSTSYSTSSDDSASHVDPRQRGMANKLLYRSKQRGFLELDLLMGLWAEANIPKMSMEDLNNMSKVLDEENPDLFKWLTGQLQAPEHLTKNPVFVALHSHVAQQLKESSAPLTRAAAGKDWVRGWDDSWRGKPADAAAAGPSSGAGAAPQAP